MIALLLALVALADPQPNPLAAGPVQLTEDYQVLQRDPPDRAACVVVLPDEAPAEGKFIVTIESPTGKSQRQVMAHPIEGAANQHGVTIDELAVGGPYTLAIAAADQPDKTVVQFRRVLVGDIWILGGQSNMYGIDLVKEDLPELPYLNMLNVLHVERNSHWCAGLPPIHRIPESHARPFLKAQHPNYSADQINTIIENKTPVGGIDCSYFFARQLYAESGVPIGLIPCATGGALAIWDPANREGNRYGFLQHHLARAGGRVKGMLFFQGEQDAIFGERDQATTKPSAIGSVSTYGQQFTTFVEALRADVHDSSAPVIFAQICRHHNSPPGRDWGWEAVREAQRQLPLSLAHSHCVPSIDLEVMDGLHLNYDSLKRMGERMARVALPYAKKDASPRTEIRLESVKRMATPKPRIAVKFSGVTGHLRAPGRPTGFVFKRPSGESFDWIFKAELDPARPDTVILWTTTMPGADVALFYGAGTAPYCNITDEADMPLPAFGPIKVE